MWSKGVNGYPVRREGVIFIVSAPSGAGKTTLVKRLLEAMPDLTLSVSYTTRAPRPGEVAGKDYHFVTKRRFAAMRSRGAFAEWAEVHGSLYGTPRRPLERIVQSGRDILLDIDVQGARHLRRCYGAAVSIFVLPPSWKELKKRLTRRGTDQRQEIQRRLENARQELREISRYDYFLLNRDLRESLEWLRSIVRAERSKVARVKRWAGLFRWPS
ncbi:MAG: guanylate kinase [Candidatus Binatia bacterium]